MIYLQLLAGLAFLLVGGEMLVRGAVTVAERLGVSPLVIGLTLVGFGTSSPELVACIQAALAGAPGIALGNVVGSNIANVLLILAIGALMAPIDVQPKAFWRDGPFMLGASLVFALLCLRPEIGRIEGAVLLICLAGYTAWSFAAERKAGDGTAELEAGAELPIGRSLPSALAIAILGLLAILVGARVLVDAAVAIATLWGVSDAVIGVSLVAIGTSLPELATTFAAARKNALDVAFGNIIGSNLFNILGIASVTALVSPLPVPHEIATFDVWVMLGTAVFTVGFAMTGWRVTRLEGAALLSAYVAYMIVVFG
jgi:cation:H+ antiporter